MSDLLLGIDMGTGSSKGILTTAEGQVVATAVRPHGMSLPRPGWAEVDAEEVWWADVVGLCRELTGRTGGDRIAGCASAVWARACCCATGTCGRCARPFCTASTCAPRPRSRS